MKFRVFAAFSLMTALAACAGGESPGGLDAERSFTIPLTQAAEVPIPQPTGASGTAVVIIYPDEIEFQLNASSITGITMAHIHNGAPGVAGPIVVTLFMPGSPTGSVNGAFASGRLNASNLPGGVTVESLKALLNGGNAYVNVHTVVNQPGEIRGQIR